MNDVYDLHQHKYFAVIYIGRDNIYVKSFNTLKRKLPFPKEPIDREACITYNKEKTKILNLGSSLLTEKDSIKIDNFMERLYHIFKTGDTDNFSIRAISDYLYQTINDLIQQDNSTLKSLDELHYAFIVPSEWEEEIREDVIRPLFIQSNLISKYDHKDRLLFYSDLESIFYGLKDPRKNYHSFKRGQTSILCRLIPVKKDQALVNLDLVRTTNNVSNISDLKLYPKIMLSNSISISCNDMKNCMRGYLLKDNKLFLNVTEDTLQSIIKDIYNRRWSSKRLDFNEPFLTERRKWKLNTDESKFIKSITTFNLCMEIGKNILTNIKEIISSNFLKQYTFFLLEDQYSLKTKLETPLVNWLKYTLECTTSCFKNLNRIELSSSIVCQNDVVLGASWVVMKSVQYADIYCQPRVINKTISDNSLTIFPDSTLDIIIDMSISLNSTSISFLQTKDNISLNKCLPSLGSFYDIRDTTTLTIKSQFIIFTEEHLLNNQHTLINKSIIPEIEAILGNDSSTTKEFLISTKLQSKEIKIGYAISIEKIILDNIIGTKEGFKDLIYSSGLVEKTDKSNKLRVITHGEGILFTLKHPSKFPLKSYFVLAQLNENYIQLTLNQAVSASTLEEKQEAIIIQEEFIPIQNIYETLCLNMWNNLIQSNTLFQPCHKHEHYNGIFETSSLETKTRFTSNLKKYISDNILAENSDLQNNSKSDIMLNNICECKITLTVNDFIDISFKPILQEISTILSASMINETQFGKYSNITTLFTLIRLNLKPHINQILTNILREITEELNLIQGIDTHLSIIPDTPNPISFFYKGFTRGFLHPIWSHNYACSIFWDDKKDIHLFSKSNEKQVVILNENTAIPLLKKGDMMTNKGLKKLLYLRNRLDYNGFIRIVFYRYKNFENINDDGLLPITEDISESIAGFPITKLERKDFSQDGLIPLLISITFIGYSSSLQFQKKVINSNTNYERFFETGEPLTLSQF